MTYKNQQAEVNVVDVNKKDFIPASGDKIDSSGKIKNIADAITDEGRVRVDLSEGISVVVNDVQIGAVELKDAESNNRANINSDGSLDTNVVNTVEVTGAVDANITNNVDVTVTNEVLTVDVNNFPQIDVNVITESLTVAGSVEVTNQPTEIAVNNFPESFEVSNFPATQNVNVTNTTVPVSGTVGVNSLPAIAITNTGFDANITNSTLSVTGSVEVTDMPAITINSVDATILNESLDVNVTNALLYVEVQNLPSSQEVSGTVSVDSLPNVVIDDTTPIQVEVTSLPTTSGSVDATIVNTEPIQVEVTSLPATSGSVDATIVNSEPIDVNITNSLSITPPANQNVTVTNAINNGIPIRNHRNFVENGPPNGFVEELAIYGTVQANINQPILIQQDKVSGIEYNGVKVKNDSENPVPVSFPSTPTVNIGTIPEVEIKNDLNSPVPVAFSSTPTVNIGTIPEVEIKNDSASPVPVTGTVNIGTMPTVTVGEVEIKNDAGSPVPVEFSSTPTVNIGTIPEVEIKNDSGSPVPVTGSVSIFNNPSVTLNARDFSNGVSQLLDQNNGHLFVTNKDTNPLTVSFATNAQPVTVENSVAINTSSGPVNVSGVVSVSNIPTVTVQNVSGQVIDVEVNNTSGPISSTNPLQTTITNTPNVSFGGTAQPVTVQNVSGQVIDVEVNNTTGPISPTNPLQTTITNTPSVSISGTPAVNATIQGTPAVNATIQGTPAVTLSGTSNAVNATIQGTPAVTLSGTSNAVNATIQGTPAVTISGTGSTVRVLNSGGTANIPVSIQGTPAVSISSSAVIPFTVSRQTNKKNRTVTFLQPVNGGTFYTFLPAVANIKFRLFYIYYAVLPPNNSGTITFQTSSGEQFLTSRFGANNTFDRSFDFGVDGWVTTSSNVDLQVSTNVAFSALQGFAITLLYAEE